MVRALVAILAVAGAVGAALIGSEPPWILAALAVVAFPLAAAAAFRSRGSARLLPGAVAALCGGALVGLLVRLAIEAPDWQRTNEANCEPVAEGLQRVVLYGAVVVFLIAAIPVLTALVRLAWGVRDDDGTSPLALYPVAVAATGIALVAASFATACG